MIEEISFWYEIALFSQFLLSYFRDRLIKIGRLFESVKDIIVAILVVKRGKYSQSFLNTSFVLLVFATLIGGPVIADNNPFIAEYIGGKNTNTIYSADIYSLPFKTTISEKPRDSIIEYTVKAGETIESIAKKFDITVDTIKWENNLKTDIIREGQVLRILPVSGIAHVVKPGDNIYTIAKKYQTDPQQIVNYVFNDFVDMDTFALAPGQIIIVPEGIKPEEKPRIERRQSAQIAIGKKGAGQFIWPTSGSISQYPVWYHMAIDIANKELPPVLAADKGTVSVAIESRYGYGNHIIIDHGNGFQTLYAHLSQINVSVGQSVSRGQVIGVVGSTGRSTGPHLHFEVRQNGQLVNPLSFL